MITGPDPVCHRGLSGHASPAAGLRLSVVGNFCSGEKPEGCEETWLVPGATATHQISTEVGEVRGHSPAPLTVAETAGRGGSKM